MNNTPRCVVSTALKDVDSWQNSTLIDGNRLEEELTALKQQPGNDIGITGSGTLVREGEQVQL